MRERLLLVAASVLLRAGESPAVQGGMPIGAWKNFTDKSNIKSVATAGSVVWAATSGGVFSYHEGTGTIVHYTNSEGLSSNDATAIFVDGGGSVWIGSREGAIDVLAPDGASWRHIVDIIQSGRVQKRIRTFVMRNDSMFIGSDFGISVFRTVQWEFGDTYANFGFVGQAGVNSILLQGNQIWAATDQGAASASLSAPNLSSPVYWNRYQTGQGLPANVVRSLVLFHDTLVAGTTNGAAFFDGGVFQNIGALNGKQVVASTRSSTQLHILSNITGAFELSRFDNVQGGIGGSFVGAGATATSVGGPSGSGVIWAGTTTKGIVEPLRNVVPNGPGSNLFSSLVVDNNGVLWCASGISGQGKGFYRYDFALPETVRWKSFGNATDPIMLFDDYYKVSFGADGRVWVSSWGRGVVEIAGDTVRRRISTPRLAAAEPPPKDPNFVVVGSIADGGGQSWLVNRTAISGNYLARIVNDTSFVYHSTTTGQGVFTNMVIDGNGTKWLANAEPFNKPATGLYYFNENNTVSGTQSTGGWGFMTIADGLPNNTVLSLAVDLTGDVYVGTDLGLMVITEPTFPKQRKYTSFPLREQSVQVIAVDAVNNKWIGTKEGVFVMNADATQILEQYSVATTGGKLVDNDIRALAIDHQRGIAYIGTDKGLSSLSIAPVATVRNFSTISLGPNPFVIPSSGDLVIRNLVTETFIKILSIDGSLVSEFKAQGGGRAFWDGRDREGKLVGTGIYFIVAFAQNGDQVGTGKVAVVRR